MANVYGITENGFELKRLDAILNDLNASAKTIFGDDLNTSPESVDGQIHGIYAEALSDLYEIAQVAFNAFNPNSATGVQLDYLAALNGLSRLQATATKAAFTLNGVAGTVVPIGTLLTTGTTGQTFATLVSVTVPVSGFVVVEAENVVNGATDYIVGDTVTIDTPITGLDSVNNTTAAIQNGTNEETDTELRIRRTASITNSAQSIIDSIFSAVSNVSNVTETAILENTGDTVDAEGLPPHSFEVVVVGGDDAAVASAIFLNRPAGILSHGVDSGVTVDAQGLQKTEKFTRATAVPIYVDVVVSSTGGFPADGVDQIKQNIVDFANGVLYPDYNFTLGGEVLTTRLFMPVNAVTGHYIDSIELSLDGVSYSPANLQMATREIPEFQTANISVTVN